MERLSPIGCLRAIELVATAKVKLKRIGARFRVHHRKTSFPRERFQQAEQVCPDATAGKLGIGIKPFKSISTNGSPSRDCASRLGNPYLQVTKLLLHAGACQARRPAVGLCLRHRAHRERADRVPAKLEEPIGILLRGQSVRGFQGCHRTHIVMGWLSSQCRLVCIAPIP